MWKPGIWELVIVLVIVLLLFGVGRLGQLGRDLGEGIREFRDGITGGEDKSEEKAEETEKETE